MRSGFSMITAIIFMILVATIGIIALSLSSISVKQTTDVYLREQAELLLQSSTEFALLAISGHDIVATGNCLSSIDSQYPQTGGNAMFDINITISYIGNNLPAGCTILGDNALVTPESNVTVIIDTVVSTNSDNNISTEPIHLHRRTIQKP
ncbi:MAG: type II secretion system protein [Sulfurospirillaceae bacterium]|nr:type II secretion system protein [Sulfurospirillaceae bacterium]